MSRRVSSEPLDVRIGRYIRSVAWTEARRGGYEIALLERLRASAFKISETDRLFLRQRAADRHRQFAEAIEAGDAERVAILRGWFEDVRATEARHMPVPVADVSVEGTAP